MDSRLYIATTGIAPVVVEGTLGLIESAIIAGFAGGTTGLLIRNPALEGSNSLEPAILMAGASYIQAIGDLDFVVRRAVTIEGSVNLATIPGALSGLDLKVRVNGGGVQTVTFPGGMTTAQDILDFINGNTSGLTAFQGTGLSGLILVSDDETHNAEIQIDSTGGTANATLGVTGQHRSATEAAIVFGEGFSVIPVDSFVEDPGIVYNGDNRLMYLRAGL